MSGDCQQIHPACAHAFQEIVGHCGELKQATSQLREDVGAMRKAVVGNGDTHGSLLARMERIEAGANTQLQMSDKFWKIFGVAAAIAAVAVAIFN